MVRLVIINRDELRKLLRKVKKVIGKRVIIE